MVLRHRVGWDPDFIARDAWFWPLAPAAAALPRRDDWPQHADLDAVYTACAGEAHQPLRFAPITPRNKGRGREPEVVRAETLYDGWITVEHVVPTRGQNWHDLLNALCFATWPASKFALHARQYRAQRARLSPDTPALPTTRTREQDALTLFDEGGLVVAALPATADALGRSSDREFEPRLRDACAKGEALLVPFGHALFEHMVEGVPCPGASARVVALASLELDATRLLGALDAALSVQLGDAKCFCAPRESMHLRFTTFAPDCRYCRQTTKAAPT